MGDNLVMQGLNHTDLNMYHCGTENCDAGHYYGPAVRDHFLIHYVHSGKGKFYVGEQEYTLQRGQCFLIYPSIVTYYQADFRDPWSYSWVGFNGFKAGDYVKSAGFAMDNPIFNYNSEDYISGCFTQMIAAKDLQRGREMRLLGLLYLFLSQLIEQNEKYGLQDQAGSRKKSYINKAVEYIERNYSRKMSISELANHLGLDRSYLGSIFKEQLGTSLQDFLIHYRLDKACELMKSENLSIGDVSRSVGYDDPLLFSKLFKKNKGISPREYRKIDHIGKG